MPEEPSAVESSKTKDAPANVSPLLVLPEYQGAADRVWREAIHESMGAINPVYASIRRVPWPEGVSSIRVQVGEADNKSPVVHLSQESEVRWEDVRDGNLEAFHEIVLTVAESHLSQFMRPFYEHVGEAAESVGNSINLGDAPLTWDAILDGYETVEWGVDDLGQVRPPQIIGAVSLPEPSRAHWERFAEIAQRKQEAHVSRRRGRRLLAEPDGA